MAGLGLCNLVPNGSKHHAVIRDAALSISVGVAAEYNSACVNTLRRLWTVNGVQWLAALAFLVLFPVLSSAAEVHKDTNTYPQSFTQAKKLLSRDVYGEDGDRQTFYCGCDYTREGKILPDSCGYVPRRAGSVRSKRLEWEHIVPASRIGRGRSCLEKGAPECKTGAGKPYKGRRCCEKVDGEFRRIEGDLHNLVPEIGELNADRRDFPYRDIPGKEREYGACDFAVDAKLKEADPAVSLRGFIGRTWLYMHKTYGIFMSDEDKEVYSAWAKEFPPQQWEIDRRQRIKRALRRQKDRP